MAADDLRSQVIGKVLAGSPTAEQLIALLQATSPPAKSADIEVERIKALAARPTLWSLVPWAALVAALASLGTAWLTGSFERDRVRDEQAHDVERALMDQKGRFLEKVLEVDPDVLGVEGDKPEDIRNAAAQERRSRICLLATFGIIDIPDFVVGVPKSDRAGYKTAAEALLEERFKCSVATYLPVALPAPSVVANTGADPDVLPMPDLPPLPYGPGKPRTTFDFQVQGDFLSDATGQVPYVPSLRGSDEPGANTPKLIVLHYTAGPEDFPANLRALLRPGLPASAHLLIGRDGEVVQMRPFGGSAFHAGQSAWNGLTGLNRWSIGIELVNRGQVSGDGVPDTVLAPDGRRYQAYSEPQMQTLRGVIRALYLGFPDIVETVGHSDVALPAGRKPDPGPLIDRKQLSRDVLLAE